MGRPRLHVQLRLADGCFAIVELGVLLAPLPSLRAWPRTHLVLALALLGGAVLIWALVVGRWRAPLDRALAARCASLEAHRAAARLGWRTLWLRTALALGVGLPPAVANARSGDTEDLWLVLWAGLLYVPHLDALRALLCEWLIRGALRPLEVDTPPLATDPLLPLREGLRGRLLLVALAMGVPAMLGLLGLALFFVPLSPPQQQRVRLLAPPLLLGLLLPWGLWVLRRARPIEHFLRRPSTEADDKLDDQAYRTAQFLPYLLGLSKVVLWLLAALILGLWGLWRWGLDAEGAVLLVGASVLVTLGTALYEMLWHRATLAPLLAHLAARRPEGVGQRHYLSLRSKMLIAFGALTLFACGLSLLWGVMQYRAVSTNYIRRLGDLRLEQLLADLREHPPVDQTSLSQLLRSRARAEVLIYHLPPGMPRPRVYAARGPVPELPPTAIAMLHSGRRGQMELPTLRLSASYGPLPATSPLGPLGGVLIAQPSHRGGDFDTAARLLVGFFVLLLLGASGAVVLTAADLTRPLRGLQRLAGAMAHGDLDPQQVPVGLEGDEIGRLYAAFEEMRRALRERFRSSTEAHFALEAQVARRTAELARRNREREEALEALERAQEELLRAEKMASLGRLVAGIAHEINNPVNAVVNTAVPLGEALSELADRAAREPDPEALRQVLAATLVELRSMARVIDRAAGRTKEIVQTLHNYSRSDPTEIGPLDLRRCVEESLDLLQHDLSAGIQVVCELPELAPVVGSAGQLQQVFTNLLTNAVQALALRPPGGDPPCIRITGQRHGQEVQVVIEDNGPGIPPEVLPRIFDPFFTTKDVGQGSGLGLAIVHSILLRHGGRISAHSEPGRGTVMTVSLPLHLGPKQDGADRNTGATA
ncbi:MAG: ATP-binding protein [Myxococcales bacterium]|nr:ATP-binding protein [Myxococcota bacterium]MDW8282505.1 ATP-binding protein [Myxococcales bacterium]